MLGPINIIIILFIFNSTYNFDHAKNMESRLLQGFQVIWWTGVFLNRKVNSEFTAQLLDNYKTNLSLGPGVVYMAILCIFISIYIELFLLDTKNKVLRRGFIVIQMIAIIGAWDMLLGPIF